MGLLVLIAHEAGRRGVALAEYDVPGDVEAGGAPRGDKPVRLVRAVKADAEAPVSQKTEDLSEGRAVSTKSIKALNS